MDGADEINYSESAGGDHFNLGQERNLTLVKSDRTDSLPSRGRDPVSDKTKIEWTDSSWNPIRARDLGPVGTGPGIGTHCEIITPGCEHCYAAAINKRLGTHRPYLKTARPHVQIYLDEKTLEAPLRWKRSRRVFVCSMSDLFGDWVTHEMLRKVFRTMEEAPQHIYQILTKRAERQRDFMQWWVMDRLDEPPLNWWFGVSVEDQRRADERIPVLFQTPAAVRWISAEPLLGPLPVLYTSWGGERLDWVVIGGESGSGARGFDVDWARDIVAQCRAAGAACFVKQLGAQPYDSSLTASGRSETLRLRDRKGGDINEFPEDLRVREYPAGVTR